MAAPKISDIRKQAQQNIDDQKKINDLTKQELSSVEKIFNTKSSILSIEKDYYNEVNAAYTKLKTYRDQIDKSEKEGPKLHQATIKALQKDIDKEKEMLSIKQQKADLEIKGLKILDAVNKAMTLSWGYLMKSDKIIRSTNIALGMSGIKAEMIRNTFEDSAGFVARYGGSLEDIGTLMTSFADETGRARILSSDMVKNGMLISQATGMGAEAAGRLAGQFEIMGMNITNTAKYVEGVMETSERMGVNSNKVFKILSNNFSKLQKYTFQSGVKGMAKMAQYSEKFKLDMSETLDSAEKARTLEGAIEMMAQLQVMGGKFADTDPFKLMYEARNLPEEYQKSIGKMTEGIAHFKQMSDGTFQSFISPVDIDRLKFASKTLGVDQETLTKTARRMGEIQEMRRRMQGMGLTNEQKTALEGMYTFNSRLNKFSVEFGGVARDVTSLTTSELSLLTSQKKSLEDRAASALTFDDTFKATIESLKATLLPMLRGVNVVLEKLRPIVNSIVDFVSKISGKSFMGVAGTFLAAAVIFKGLSTGLILPLTSFMKTFAKKSFAGTLVRGAEKYAEGGKSPVGGILGGGGAVTPTLEGGKAMKAAGVGRGVAAAGIGAGIGLAAAGVGAGIGLAAEGISKLADAMTKLDPKKVEALQGIVRSISIVVGIGAGLAAVIIGIALASGVAAAPLAALALPILGIGAGIGLATAGIGAMGLGIAKMIDSTKGAAKGISDVALGIGAIGLAMAGGGIGALLGGSVLINNLAKIGAQAPAIAQVGDAFKQINTAISGSADEFNNIKEMIAAISNMNVSKLSPLKDLANMFNKPLQVEFSDKKVAVVSNITLNMDGKKIISQLNFGVDANIQQDRQRRGSGGSNSITTTT